LRKRLGELEQQLEALSEQRDALDHRLSDTALYTPESKPQLLALMEDKRRLSDELDEVEAAWLSAGEELERLAANPD
jgi:hypothetical protein